MPTTYAPQPATLSGQLLTVDRRIKNPVMLQRALRTLVQQRLISDKILTQKVDLTGTGAANYEVSEPIMVDDAAEAVDDLMEYPLTGDQSAVSAIASSVRWGLGIRISDALIARNRVDALNRRMIKLANRIAFGFDALCLSAVATAVSQTSSAVAAWNNTSADPFADITLAASVADSLNQGYSIDTVLATPTRWARLIAAAKIIERAPRESDSSLLITGRLAQIAGLNILKTTNMPSGVNVMVLDSTVLGTIGYEDLGGGYLGSADDVQSKRIRLDSNDGWQINARRVGVPMVQEPGAAVIITGS